MANNKKSPCDQPCSKEEIKKAFEGAACTRITWDYQIYAAENELKADKRISIWARYDNDVAPLWKRICVINCELNWKAYHIEKGKKTALSFSKVDQEELKVVNNTIEFNGGFLEIEDPGLKDLLRPLGIPLLDTAESQVDADCPPFVKKDNSKKTYGQQHLNWQVSDNIKPLVIDEQRSLAEVPGLQKNSVVSQELDQAVVDDLVETANDVAHTLPPGRNIHIEVEFWDDATKKMQPLFYFPQNDDDGKCGDLGVVFLGTSKDRRLFWTISNQYLISDRFELESENNAHLISVSQDINWLSKQLGVDEKPYFEMMVDSIGLGTEFRLSGQEESLRKAARRSIIRHANKESDAQSIYDLEADHDFGTGPRTFWVGFVPQNQQHKCAGFPTEDLGASWQGKFFKGTIKRLYFDPNSSCSAC